MNNKSDAVVPSLRAMLAANDWARKMQMPLPYPLAESLRGIID